MLALTRARDAGASGAQALGKMLEQNTTLETLVLWQNEIGNEGSVSIAQALKKNTTLKMLNIKKNDIEIDFDDMLRAITLEKPGFKLIADD